MRKEHRTVHVKLVRLWNQIQRHPPADTGQQVLHLLCKSMWDIIDSMHLLVERKRGVAAFILSRSIFEYSAVADVLAKNPTLVSDYVNSGKLIVYEVGQALGAPVNAAQRSEYDTIKAKLGGKKWHGGKTIEQLVNQSHHGQVLQPGESGLYKTFYKEASSLSHGDSYVFLRHTPKTGWQMTFEKSDRAAWGVRGLNLAYQILAATLHSVQEALGLGLGQKFVDLIPDLEALSD